MLLTETAFVKEPVEQTIEAFVASRSQNGAATWFYFLVVLLVASLCGFCAGTIQNFLKNAWHWTPDDAESGAQLFRLHILLLASVGVEKMINFGKSSLQIDRGEGWTFPGGANFQFWEGKTVPTPITPSMSRILPTLGGLFLGLFLLGLVFVDDSLIDQIMGCFGLMLCAYSAYRNVFPRPYPLLVMVDEQLKVRGRSLRWKTVHQVQVQHWKNINTASDGLKLVFRDHRRKKIADVVLDEAKCSVAQERLMLDFIAEVLGGEVKTIAPSR